MEKKNRTDMGGRVCTKKPSKTRSYLRTLKIGIDVRKEHRTSIKNYLQWFSKRLPIFISKRKVGTVTGKY